MYPIIFLCILQKLLALQIILLIQHISYCFYQLISGDFSFAEAVRSSSLCNSLSHLMSALYLKCIVVCWRKTYINYTHIVSFSLCTWESWHGNINSTFLLLNILPNQTGLQIAVVFLLYLCFYLYFLIGKKSPFGVSTYSGYGKILPKF